MAQAGDSDFEPWLRLIRTPGLGPSGARRLLQHFGSAAAAASARSWSSAGLDSALQRACRAVPTQDLEADLQWLQSPAHDLITATDPRYPERLGQLPGAPLALFTRGDPELLGRPQIAIVGARSATPQGLENAQAFAAELCRRGLVVTSGLALGVDAAAHRGALAAGGLTIAACATGLDRVYPARHRDLAHQIIEEGLLVSEFPTGVTARAESFPRRNRIISGLSLGVLVVEAANPSGSLVTARHAAEQGRELFAIPGSIHNPMARGCHRLIRDGAKLVETAADILEEIAPQLGLFLPNAQTTGAEPPAQTTAAVDADSAAGRVLAAVGDASTAPDQIIASSGLSAAQVSAELLILELAGRISRLADGGYMRTGKS